ncbi:MAG: dynamin family protein [Chloroflexi bacterium]|nr:dynamin family protein [Chloroflexota bacterium]
MPSDPIAKLEAARSELKRLTSVLTQLGEESQVTRLTTLHNNLCDRAVRVVTIGAFNQGKSTLINALIGAKVLPVALVPTTAVMTRVVSANPPGATLYYAGSSQTTREVSLEEVSAYLIIDPEGKPRAQLRLVEVRCPWRSAVGSPLDLYDTPGFNDRSEQAAAAREAIENADLLLFMLDARQPLTEQEELIWQGWVAQVGARPLFLLNFLNLLEEEDRELALQRVRTGLRERLNLSDEPELLEINALLALRSRLRHDQSGLANSGLPELIARLDYFNETGRLALLEATRVGRFQRVLGEIYTENQTRLLEAEEKRRGWRERQNRQEHLWRQAERAANNFAGLEEWKKRSLAEFEPRLLAELETAVEQWPLPKLRSQMEGLTGQRMREWLAYFELECNKLLGSIAISGTFKPLKFSFPSVPAYHYTYSPPPPDPNPNPFEDPLDFLGSTLRGLGQRATEFTTNLFENGLNMPMEENNQASQWEERERVVAHSRLVPLVQEAVARLEKQVSAVLAAARPTFVSKIAPPEPVPPGLETEVSLRRTFDETLVRLVTQLSR